MLICEAFSRQLIRCFAGKLSTFKFSNVNATVEVSKMLPVSFDAYDRRGQHSRRRVQTNVKLLSIVPALISDECITYSLEVAPIEYSTILEAAKRRVAKHWDLANFSSFSFELEEEEKVALEEYSQVSFWETVLPGNVSYRTRELLSDFMDTLNAHRMSDTVGEEVLLLGEVYFAAAKVFPEFRKLSKSEQVRIMDLAYTLGKRVERGKRDIHSFSKAAFYAIEAAGYASTFVLDGKKYTVKSNGPKIDCESMLGQTKCRRCFLPFDLWHGIARATGYLVA
jgi:hypothetical protein